MSLHLRRRLEHTFGLLLFLSLYFACGSGSWWRYLWVYLALCQLVQIFKPTIFDKPRMAAGSIDQEPLLRQSIREQSLALLQDGKTSPTECIKRDTTSDPFLTPEPPIVDDFNLSLSNNASSCSPSMETPSSEADFELFDGLLQDMDSPPMNDVAGRQLHDHTPELDQTSSTPTPDICPSIELQRHRMVDPDSPERNWQPDMPTTQICESPMPYSLPGTPQSHHVYPHTTPTSPFMPQDHTISQRSPINPILARSFSQPPEQMTFHRSGHYLGRPLGSRNRTCAAFKALNGTSNRRNRHQDLHHPYPDARNRHNRVVRIDEPRSVPLSVKGSAETLNELSSDRTEPSQGHVAHSEQALRSNCPPAMFDAVLRMVRAGESLIEGFWEPKESEGLRSHRANARRINNDIHTLEEPFALLVPALAQSSPDINMRGQDWISQVPKTGKDLRDLDGPKTRRLLEIYNLSLGATFTFERKAMYLRFIGANEPLMHAVLD